MTLDEVVARVPGWGNARQVRAEPLAGGITNENYRVEVDGQHFVVRLGGRDAELLGIDRRREWAALQVAARLGIGAEVVFALPDQAVLVTRWVAGTPLTNADVGRPETLARIAATLRHVHAASPIRGAFSPFRVVEVYREVALRHGVALPPAVDDWLACGRRIEAALGPAPAVLCHNDLLAGNLIDAAGTIRILDWEYAAMGDRFFDLANLAANAELGPAEETRLLACYFEPAVGDVPPDAPARLALMRLASDLREGMWGLVQVGISRLEFDFADDAARHFARFATRAATISL